MFGMRRRFYMHGLACNANLLLSTPQFNGHVFRLRFHSSFCWLPALHHRIIFLFPLSVRKPRNGRMIKPRRRGGGGRLSGRKTPLGGGKKKSFPLKDAPRKSRHLSSYRWRRKEKTAIFLGVKKRPCVRLCHSIPCSPEHRAGKKKQLTHTHVAPKKKSWPPQKRRGGGGGVLGGSFAGRYINLGPRPISALPPLRRRVRPSGAMPGTERGGGGKKEEIESVYGTAMFSQIV